jgi:hypothetical protein
MYRSRWSRLLGAVAVALFITGYAPFVHAQGVTTGVITGVVVDAQGGVVPGASVTALHVPSGTTYEGVSQADGRFFIPGMRVGGPYKLSASLPGFGTETQENVTVTLGVSTDMKFTLKVASVSETVTVTATAEFSSARTGAATSISREDLAALPTTAGKIADMVRMTPQVSGNMQFAGQDNRLNNLTVDGSYFNNSFGLQGAPGERTGVAPISLEAIEQVQVSVAPFDVRQGNFVGAGVNTVTRSGTNQLRASGYYRVKNQDYVGTNAHGNTVNPGVFNNKQEGVWAGGPLWKNKLFAFGNFENEKYTAPITTLRANTGSEAVGGNVTRVLASDLTNLSSFLKSKFNYDTGPFENIPKETPQKRFLLRSDYNLSNNHKLSFRYNYLDSVTDVMLSGSSSLGVSRASGNSTTFLSFQNSNYQIMENIRSGIGEWNGVFRGNIANNLIVGYTKQDESRNSRGQFFPFVDIMDGSNVAYTSFGFEPFTPNNELRYWTFQLQDHLTWFTAKHSVTVGGSYERYRSENVFFPGKQSAYVYRTLADFYTDANDYLAHPNRTTSPVNLSLFQVRYNNIPGQDKPIQPLKVQYSGVYAQDEWRPRKNLTVTAGIRMDVPVFANTAFDNANVDKLTFRDETGAGVQYNTGKLPDAKMLWSPRVGFNWDVAGDQTTQLRGGTGLFTGRPAYVWISNQVGNTGVLTGFDQLSSTTVRPFNPNPDAYKPTTVTGAPATSVDLAVTDRNFKFPQVWRSNVAVDRKLPGGMVGTVEYLYNRDINGIYYINANLPAAQSAFVGADNRPRWMVTSTTPSCAAAGNPSGCVTRINNATGNQVTNAIVLKNENVGRSWNIATTLSKNTRWGLNVKGAYSYGRSRNTVDAGSIASGSWTGNPIASDPNNPILGYSGASPGHRLYIRAAFARQLFKFGMTSVAVFWNTYTGGNSSYVFSGDMNGDTASGNDLIYIPRDQSEMNFVTFTASGKTFSAADQAAAFDAYISGDKYLSKHRGQYAQRGAVFLPRVTRTDLSFVQDVFGKLGSTKHTGQFRIDILNFSNMLNHNWGVSQSVTRNQILTNAAADSQGRASYRLAVFNNDLVRQSFQRNAGFGDVYSFMLTFRYTFN